VKQYSRQCARDQLVSWGGRVSFITTQKAPLLHRGKKGMWFTAGVEEEVPPLVKEGSSFNDSSPTRGYDADRERKGVSIPPYPREKSGTFRNPFFGTRCFHHPKEKRGGKTSTSSRGTPDVVRSTFFRGGALQKEAGRSLTGKREPGSSSRECIPLPWSTAPGRRGA